MERPRDINIAATRAEPLPADPAPGAEALPKDSERVVAGPGVTFTRTMWHDAWMLALVGVIAGAAVGAVVGVVWENITHPNVAIVAICVVAFAFGGSVLGFVLGGMQGAAEDADPEASRNDARFARPS